MWARTSEQAKLSWDIDKQKLGQAASESTIGARSGGVVTKIAKAPYRVKNYMRGAPVRLETKGGLKISAVPLFRITPPEAFTLTMQVNPTYSMV
jgi:hypothetical protein